MQRTPQVFISYAREDSDKVVELRSHLGVRGYSPWMDKFDIIGGEDWERAIVRAVRQCDFFLFCASRNSVNKRGAIQREIKEALDVWKERLEDDIFFIPVRLEPCDIPGQIRRFQWIDLFEPDGLRQIERSITAGLTRLESPNSTTEIRIENKAIRMDEANIYAIDATYPELQPPVAPGIAAINAALSSFATQLVYRFKKEVQGFSGEAHLPPNRPANTLNLSYICDVIADDLVTCQFTRYLYFFGAAHGNTLTTTFNLRRRPFLELSLHDIFPGGDVSVQEISTFCISDLARQLGTERAADPMQRDWLSRGAGPQVKNFSKFLLRKTGVLFIFDPYEVASYADGRKEVLFPIERVAELLDPEITAILKNA